MRISILLYKKGCYTIIERKAFYSFNELTFIILIKYLLNAI